MWSKQAKTLYKKLASTHSSKVQKFLNKQQMHSRINHHQISQSISLQQSNQNQILQQSIRHFAQNSSFSSSFASKAAGKAKLNQFLKYVHPDMFGQAPDNIRATNAKSVQELNEFLTYLQSQQYQNGVQGKIMEFYVRRSPQKPQAEQNEKGPQKKKEKKGPVNEDDFVKFSIELLPLKPQQSQEIKNMHYTNTVESLNSALENILFQEEDRNKDYFEDLDTPYKTKIRWDHVTEKYKNPIKEKEDLQKAAKWRTLELIAFQKMQKATRSQVLDNVYRKYYDIPSDLKVRKSDPDMRFAVRTSEALTRSEQLQEKGINPQNIFFDKDLEEHQIMKCIQILQADKLKADQKHSHFSKLFEINQALNDSAPSIYIMFAKTESYKHDELPGYIIVPYSFEIDALNKYCKNHAGDVREKARKFVDDQLQFDLQLSDLQSIITPNLNISKKLERDFDLIKYILCMKHLSKYLKQGAIENASFEGMGIQRIEWLKTIASVNNQVFLYKKFKVFNDRSIEIPLDFKDEEFDEFLYQAGRKGIYDFGIADEKENLQFSL
eukprot:403374758